MRSDGDHYEYRFRILSTIFYNELTSVEMRRWLYYGNNNMTSRCDSGSFWSWVYYSPESFYFGELLLCEPVENTEINLLTMNIEILASTS